VVPEGEAAVRYSSFVVRDQTTESRMKRLESGETASSFFSSAKRSCKNYGRVETCSRQ
jgi:hypothetical protein